MSREVGELLQPVGRSAAQKAVERVFGLNSGLDPAKYNKHIERLALARPTFVRAIEELGLMRAQQGAISVGQNNYRAGAAIYYGAIQEQAKEVGEVSPKVKRDDIKQVVLAQFAVVNAERDFENLFGVLAGIEPVQEAASKVIHDGASAQEDFDKFIEATGGRDTEAQVLVFADNAEQNRNIFEKAHQAAEAGLAHHVLRFSGMEAEFVGVMTETWWGDKFSAQASDEQRIGSTDAFLLVETVLERS